MSLDTDVRGDPAACREAAHRLTRLGTTVSRVADSLVRQSHLSVDDFGGLSGDAFRGHAGDLAGSADATARRCTRLGSALAELAQDLEDVRRLMELARTRARPWLTVDAHAVRPPGVDPRMDDPWAEQAWSAWREVVLLVDRAREVEHRAQHDWRTALWQLADAAPPDPNPWDDNPLDDTWPDGIELPPYQPLLGPHVAPALAPASAPASAPVSAPAGGHGGRRDEGCDGGREPVGHPSPGHATATPTGPATAPGGSHPGTHTPPPEWGFGVVEPAPIQHAALWQPPLEDPSVPVCGTPGLPEVLRAPR